VNALILHLETCKQHNYLSRVFCTECRRNGWDPKAFATTLALAYFLRKLNDLKEDWELIADKSKIWLMDKYAPKADAMFESALKNIPA